MSLETDGQYHIAFSRSNVSNTLKCHQEMNNAGMVLIMTGLQIQPPSRISS